MKTDQQYRKKVWDYLRAMNPDSAVEISSVCTTETREQFIECIKMYMDCTPWQGWLSFNANYTKIYKVHPIDFKENPPLSVAMANTLPSFSLKEGNAKKFERKSDKSDEE